MKIVLEKYEYPGACHKCDVEFRVVEHMFGEVAWLAKFCPFCGASCICPNCHKPNYECECEDDDND